MTDEPIVGGVYSVARGKERRFGIVKVLAFVPESNTIHARVFERCVSIRPEVAWFDDRTPGVLDKVLQVAIGTLPITRRVFAYWQPEFLFAQELTDVEQDLLDAYGVDGKPWDDLQYA